jgi:hypothetical protein
MSSRRSIAQVLATLAVARVLKQVFWPAWRERAWIEKETVSEAAEKVLLAERLKELLEIGIDLFEESGGDRAELEAELEQPREPWRPYDHGAWWPCRLCRFHLDHRGRHRVKLCNIYWAWFFWRHRD